jgi:beta-mannanase
MSGVSAGTLAQADQWSAFRHRPIDVIVTFADRSNWETITHPWLGAGAGKFAGFAGTWVISQPFFPTSDGNIGSCASGAYNGHWQEFGRWLTGQGRADTIIRLAWEPNGSWFPWSALDEPGSWVGCFRQVVGAIRQTDPQVRIDWTINSHTDGAFDVYPGDAYVDIIGIDTFDMWPASTDESSWKTQCNETEGLCSVIKFARAHNKKFSVPEWGLVGKYDTGAGAAGQSGGDNPFYIRKMHETFLANADVLSYEAYFNNSDAGNVHSSLTNPTEQPSGAQTYASLW